MEFNSTHNYNTFLEMTTSLYLKRNSSPIPIKLNKGRSQYDAVIDYRILSRIGRNIPVILSMDWGLLNNLSDQGDPYPNTNGRCLSWRLGNEVDYTSLFCDKKIESLVINIKIDSRMSKVL